MWFCETIFGYYVVQCIWISLPLLILLLCHLLTRGYYQKLFLFTLTGSSTLKKITWNDSKKKLINVLFASCLNDSVCVNGLSKKSMVSSLSLLAKFHNGCRFPVRKLEIYEWNLLRLRSSRPTYWREECQHKLITNISRRGKCMRPRASSNYPSSFRPWKSNLHRLRTFRPFTTSIRCIITFILTSLLSLTWPNKIGDSK